MQLSKVVIIIPTYNEVDNIQPTIKALFHHTASCNNHEIHILVFDSNSQDGTQDKIHELQTIYPRLHLQTEAKKSGLGSAYLTAMRYTLEYLEADIIVEFDADLSHQPDYLPAMLDLMNDYQVVIGSRYVKGGEICTNWPWHRLMISKIGNYIARICLSPQYMDFTSGYRLTRANLLKKVLPSRFISNNYAYKLELFWLLIQHQARIKEYPIRFVDRTSGDSKLPKNSIYDSLYTIFILRLRQFFQSTQLKIN